METIDVGEEKPRNVVCIHVFIFIGICIIIVSLTFCLGKKPMIPHNKPKDMCFKPTKILFLCILDFEWYKFTVKLLFFSKHFS